MLRAAPGARQRAQNGEGTIYGLRFATPERDADGKPRRVYETLGKSWEGCDLAGGGGARAERLLARVRPRPIRHPAASSYRPV